MKTKLREAAAAESSPAAPPTQTTLKFKLTVAYDGTNYAGWQVQKTGVGVQERVEAALRKIFPSVQRIHGSSRTDTGVHALGMVAHVEIPVAEFRMPERKLALAVNAHLPEDIRVLQARPAAADFHARFDATGKQYRYFIWNHPTANPLLRHLAWHVPQTLDLTAMRSASRCFLGTHDFESFAANRNYKIENTVRTLTRCSVRRAGPMLTVIIDGDGFLYKMCRCLVGTLVQVGQGKFPADEIAPMLRRKERRGAGMSAPAHGLVLWKVFYGVDDRSNAARIGVPNRPSAVNPVSEP